MKKTNTIFIFILVFILIFTLSACNMDIVKDNAISPYTEQQKDENNITNNEIEGKSDINDEYVNDASKTDGELNGEEVYIKIKDAVVEIFTYDKLGTPIAQGSGFFVSEKEICTNFHVIEDAYKIAVVFSDGKQTGQLVVKGYNVYRDIASIELTKYSHDKYLEIDTTLHNIGESVYTLGSSEGLTGTFSNGIISHNDRKIKDINCYQITAPISHGNSGGPMVSNNGKVIGINSMSLTSGQNLNFAIKISEYVKMDKTKTYTASEFYNMTHSF